MASKVTYKLMKQWLSESDFAQKHEWKTSSWNDYYYILSDTGKIMCSGKTPGACWKDYQQFLCGYYLAKEEMQTSK